MSNKDLLTIESTSCSNSFIQVAGDGVRGPAAISMSSLLQTSDPQYAQRTREQQGKSGFPKHPAALLDDGVQLAAFTAGTSTSCDSWQQANDASAASNVQTYSQAQQQALQRAKAVWKLPMLRGSSMWTGVRHTMAPPAASRPAKCAKVTRMENSMLTGTGCGECNLDRLSRFTAAAGNDDDGGGHAAAAACNQQEQQDQPSQPHDDRISRSEHLQMQHIDTGVVSEVVSAPCSVVADDDVQQHPPAASASATCDQGPGNESCLLPNVDSASVLFEFLR